MAKLTPKIQDRICQAIRAGNYKRTAAQWVGISEKTLYEWIRKGREAEDPHNKYAIFADALDEAVSAAEVHNVAIIQKAAEKQWQASAWMLERRHPDRWGRNDKQRIEMNAEVEVAASEESKDKLRSLLDGIAKRIAEAKDSGDADG